MLIMLMPATAKQLTSALTPPPPPPSGFRPGRLHTGASALRPERPGAVHQPAHHGVPLGQAPQVGGGARVWGVGWGPACQGESSTTCCCMLAATLLPCTCRSMWHGSTVAVVV
jgi:hypothetical protein